MTWRERELEEPETEKHIVSQQDATTSCTSWADARLEPSCCSPALTAAAAWREVEADRLGEGEGREAEGEVGGSLPSLLAVVLLPLLLVVVDDIPKVLNLGGVEEEDCEVDDDKDKDKGTEDNVGGNATGTGVCGVVVDVDVDAGVGAGARVGARVGAVAEAVVGGGERVEGGRELRSGMVGRSVVWVDQGRTLSFACLFYGSSLIVASLF